MSALRNPSTIAKLLPRLASPFDAEVINTARAISRALAASGRDWHDIARGFDALSRPQPIAPNQASPWARRRTGAAPPLWGEMSTVRQEACLRSLASTDCLSDWEIDFIASLSARNRRALSQRQEITINRIIARAAMMWAPL